MRRDAATLFRHAAAFFSPPPGRFAVAQLLDYAAATRRYFLRQPLLARFRFDAMLMLPDAAMRY